MGNISTRIQAKNGGAVRVSKQNGKMLEFPTPVIVRELLTSHPDCYVGAFKEATQPLPPNYKLRVGRVYYLLPLVDKLDDCNTRSVKIVITKKQLHRLMARQIGLNELLFDSLMDSSGLRVSRVMDTIPEGVESS